jgi:hypothetical protein
LSLYGDPTLSVQYRIIGNPMQDSLTFFQKNNINAIGYSREREVFLLNLGAHHYKAKRLLNYVMLSIGIFVSFVTIETLIKCT